MDFGGAASGVEGFCRSGFGDAEEDVFLYCALEEGWFLGDEGHGFAIFANVEGGDVCSVCEDLAALDVVEAFEERDYGCFAAA